MPANIRNVAKVTADAQVNSGLTIIYWVAASAGGTGGNFEFNNALTDTSSDEFVIDMPANSVFFAQFNPPLEFRTGLYVDVPGTNLTVNIGYH
jgi:hypothetical protein